MRIVFEAALAAAAVICGGMWFVIDMENTALMFYMACKGYHIPTMEELQPYVRDVLYGMLGRTGKG